MNLILKTVILIFVILNYLPSVYAQNSVTPSEFITEPPTLICLGFEWKIKGDDNRNAKVEVFYRKTGETEWSKALPLLRIGGEKVFRPDVLQGEYITPDMFAGSIMDLISDTEYECKLIMSDPDGLNGESTKIVKIRTRPEPKALTLKSENADSDIYS